MTKYVVETAKKLGLEAQADKVGNVVVQQARLAGPREGPERVPAGPPRHGVREEQGQGPRLHEGPDRARAQGQNVLMAERHHARRGQRHRRGDEPGHHGGQEPRARAARVPLHRGRGDRPHRRQQPRPRTSSRAGPCSTSTPRRRARSTSAARAAGTRRARGRSISRRRPPGRRPRSSRSRASRAGTRASRSTRAAATRSRSSPASCLRLTDLGARLASIEGGNKHNAIPREAEALVFVPKKAWDEAVAAVAELKATDQGGVRARSDPDLSITLTELKGGRRARSLKKALQKKMLQTILALPHGVIKMSADIPGLVETSTNVAVIQTTTKSISLATSQRSSVASEIDEICETVRVGLRAGRRRGRSGRAAIPAGSRTSTPRS